MKLFKLTRAVAFVAAVISTTSCSTRHLRVAKLKEGVRYEVRKAVDAKTTFRPEMMSSYYFTLTPTKAPLIAGTTQHLTVRTTAYCHTEADHIVYGAKSAVGTPLRFGTVRSAAADWSRFQAEEQGLGRPAGPTGCMRDATPEGKQPASNHGALYQRHRGLHYYRGRSGMDAGLCGHALLHDRRATNHAHRNQRGRTIRSNRDVQRHEALCRVL